MNHRKEAEYRFLVIQQKMVGDVLTSTVICQALKELYPGCHVSYVANESTLAVLEHNPHIDRLHIVKKEADRNMIRFIAFLAELSKERFDAVLDAYGKLQSNLMALVVSSPKKVAYHKWYSSFLYHVNLRPIRDQRTDIATAIRARLKLLEPLTEEKNIPVVYPALYLDPRERDEAQSRLSDSGLDMKKPILMVTALGSSAFKTYPLDYLALLLDRLIGDCPDLQIVYNYLPRQRDEVDQLYNLCASETRNRTFPGFYADSLRAFIATVSCCTAVMGNEGGGINIAKALSVPSFCIFNPSITKKAWHSDARPEQWGVHLRDFHPELFRDRNLRAVKKENQEYYRLFTPNLFSGLLRDFSSTYLCPDASKS